MYINHAPSHSLNSLEIQELTKASKVALNTSEFCKVRLSDKSQGCATSTVKPCNKETVAHFQGWKKPNQPVFLVLWVF